MRFSTARLVALAILFSAGAGAQTAAPDFSKAFSPSTIGPGSVTTLTFAIANASGSVASDLAFTDVLPAGMTIAAPANASTSCTSDRGGAVVLSAPEGGTSVSLAGGVLAPSSSCEVQVNVTSATVGVSTNTSGDLTSSLGNSGSATADLEVSTSLPGFSKSFAPATVVLGGRSTLTFTIDNSANGANVNDLDFTDVFPTGMVVASPANASTTCGTATIPATLTAVAGSGSVILDANGVSTFPAVASGASCTVSVDVETTSAGALGNVSQDLLANFVSAGKASAVLDVVASTLQLSKSFLQDPVPPGGTVPLSFSLRNINRDGAATGLTFTDDLDDALSGLLATGTLPATVCNGGTLSTPDGGMTLEFSGGSLGVAESCTFEIDVTVPTGAATGGYTNVTSGVSGEVNGSPAAGREATALLFVETVPVLTKTFLDNPVTPGADVTLEFSITNTSPDFAASNIAFFDPLSTFLSTPLPVTLPPSGFCGPGSSLTIANPSGLNEGVQLSMGSLPAGGSCTFSLDIALPVAFPGGDYTNTTSDISATINGATLVGGPATDVLSVLEGPRLVKEFTDDPVVPGGTATLAFTLDFPSEGSLSASSVAFSDDLDATLTGLVATGLPVAACGGTLSSADFGSTLDFSGGTLDPGEECAFSVSVTVPGTASSGTYPNTTSALTSTVGGVDLVGATASDDLAVTDLRFTKAFLDDPVAPGADVTLEFTLSNGSTSLPMTDIVFTDDLDAVVSGLVATALPPSPVCGGTLSSLSGGGLLSFVGGALAAGETCAFSVTLGVPASAEPGLYANVTSVISATFNGGTITAAPATDGLAVDDVVPPTLSAAFVPAFIAPGGLSQLTLTIDNADSVDPASALAVTATLAAGIEIASPTDAASTCGGTVTAVDGGSTLDLSGGTVAAGATCTVSVSVTGASLGMYLANTTVLSSSLGTSNDASAKLTIEEPADIVVTKADALDDTDGDTNADEGETIVYTVVIAPTGTLDRTSTFTDTPDANTTIVPGSVSVDAGGTIVSGNAPGEGTLVVTFQDLAETATLTFEVLVGAYPDETAEVCNQGTFSGDFEGVLSDDPDVVGGGATCTALAPPNEPPVADAGEDQTLECTSPGGTTVTLDGSGSSDPDEDELTYSWAVGGSEVATGVAPDITLPTGTTVVTLTVTDPSGETDTDDVEITVEDTTPPVITLNGAASVEVVRFSGAYVDPGATAEDACEGTVAVTASGTVDTTVPGVYTITYAATDGAGNPAEATRTVTVVDDPGAIASAYLFLVEKDLKVDGQIRTEGDVHSNDKLEFKNGIKAGDGGPSLHVGNATASDDLKVHKDQRIEGNVRAPSVDIKNGAVVTGTATEGPVAVVALPTVAVSAAGADVDVADDGTLSLPPGSYGKLDLGKRAVLTLSAGTYTFEEIKMDADARLEADLTAGPVTVNVENKMDLKDDVVIVPTPFGEADSRYLTFRVANGNVDLGKGSVVAAQVIAPESKVTIDKDSRFVGVVIADKLDVKEGATALFVTAVPPVFVTTLVAEDGRPAPEPETPGSIDEEPVVADEVATAVAPQSRVIPEVFALGTTYPNPMDRSARVRYDVPVASAVRLEVYDTLGRQVAVLVDGAVEAGSHEAVFYAHRLPAGTYLVRFTSAEGFAQTRPVTVLR